MICRIGDLVTFNPESIKKNNNYDTINYLDTANLTNNIVSEIVNLKISEAPSRAKRIVRKGDILYSIVRPNLCHYGIVEKNYENLICSTGFAVLRANENVNPYYLYFYLTLPVITEKLHSIAENSTSAYPSIKPDAIANIKINIPSIDIQNKVANILKALESKIGLNNQTNDNLYELAIDYLNERVKVDEVPISNFAKIQGGYAFKSKDLINSPTNNRVIKIKNLRNEISIDVLNSQFIEDDIVKKIDKKFKLNEGDVVIAMTGAELGKTGFIYGNDNYYLNQRVGVIRGHNEKKELYLKILFLSKNYQTLLNSKGYGSAQPNISTTDIENILVKDINEDDLNDFYKNIKPVYDSIISNCEEILILEQLRDTLLLKLMNGEINLENVEI